MRSLFCLGALLLSLGTARADDARAVPAVGSKLTYRFLTTTTTPKGGTTAGEVYTYIVTAADAASAEGIIKPVALIMHCKGGAADLGCRTSAEAPGAHFDGDLLTLPIAGEVGDALAKQSHFKLAYFILEERKFPLPGVRDPKHPNFSDVGPEPIMVLTNTLRCDLAGLPPFLPVGAAPHVALPCEMRFERSASRDGQIPPQTISGKISFDVSYTGTGWVTLPSGNWEVKKLAFKMLSDDTTRPSSEGESLFSPQLGAMVKSHLTTHSPTIQATIESTIELISVAP